MVQLNEALEPIPFAVLAAAAVVISAVSFIIANKASYRLEGRDAGPALPFLVATLIAAASVLVVISNWEHRERSSAAERPRLGIEESSWRMEPRAAFTAGGRVVPCSVEIDESGHVRVGGNLECYWGDALQFELEVNPLPVVDMLRVQELRYFPIELDGSPVDCISSDPFIVDRLATGVPLSSVQKFTSCYSGEEILSTTNSSSLTADDVISLLNGTYQAPSATASATPSAPTKFAPRSPVKPERAVEEGGR